MSTIGKKKMNQITLKKLAPERLIKCYVCNKLFNTQNQFSEHLEQHQNKINRTNIEEIQRKTHESFRSKKQPPNVLRTTATKRIFQHKNCREDQKEESRKEKEKQIEKDQEEQVSVALRQSQIMLERIQFLTQVNFEDHEAEQTREDQEQQQPQVEKNIENQRALYRELSKMKVTSPENLILATFFQTKYFENYQQQLRHLKKLAEMSINPSSLDRIQSIITKICKDTFDELEQLYKQQQQQKKGKPKQSALDFWLQEASSKVHFCSECYSQIQMGAQLYLNNSNIAYHVDCFQQIFQ